ncbi:MAG: hypothetical protein Q4B09_11580 [Lachnospiraceae bacterium]|nr:hypothetical protein [Lachnospiraceae bacterium]
MFVKGDHFELYKAEWDLPDAHEVRYAVPESRTISPNSIEGIRLNDREIENPSLFWQEKAQGWGTMESFKETAGHISEVQERLDAGESLDEIRNEPDLRNCADAYFADKVKVFEGDGYYAFDSNGRHRVLAAREAGQNIPVDVIGYYGQRDISEAERAGLEKSNLTESREPEAYEANNNEMSRREAESRDPEPYKANRNDMERPEQPDQSEARTAPAAETSPVWAAALSSDTASEERNNDMNNEQSNDESNRESNGMTL